MRINGYLISTIVIVGAVAGALVCWSVLPPLSAGPPVSVSKIPAVRRGDSRPVVTIKSFLLCYQASGLASVKSRFPGKWISYSNVPRVYVITSLDKINHSGADYIASGYLESRYDRGDVGRFDLVVDSKGRVQSFEAFQRG